MLASRRMKFDGFDWDSGNERKCQKHGLEKTEIEYFFLKKKVHTAPDIKHSISEQRFLAIGLGVKHKPIVVAFTFRKITSKVFIRPISARYMNKKEIKKYAKIFEENKNK